MTTGDFLNKLRDVATCLQDEDTRQRVGIAAINRVLANAKIRIFEDGRATNGTPIGKYSTKAIYVAQIPGVPKIRLKGKTGKPTKKTRYYPGGYKQYRADVGRQNARVDLNLTSSMFGAYRGGFNEAGETVIGFTNKNEAAKMEGNEARFRKTIAPPTDQEREFGYEAAALEIIEIIEEKLT